MSDTRKIKYHVRPRHKFVKQSEWEMFLRTASKEVIHQVFNNRVLLTPDRDNDIAGFSPYQIVDALAAEIKQIILDDEDNYSGSLIYIHTPEQDANRINSNLDVFRNSWATVYFANDGDQHRFNNALIKRGKASGLSVGDHRQTALVFEMRDRII